MKWWRFLASSDQVLHMVHVIHAIPTFMSTWYLSGGERLHVQQCHEH